MEDKTAFDNLLNWSRFIEIGFSINTSQPLFIYSIAYFVWVEWLEAIYTMSGKTLFFKSPLELVFLIPYDLVIDFTASWSIS